MEKTKLKNITQMAIWLIFFGTMSNAKTCGVTLTCDDLDRDCLSDCLLKPLQFAKCTQQCAEALDCCICLSSGEPAEHCKSVCGN
jgi:hypothetical protein